jgi:hypothetical protein
VLEEEVVVVKEENIKLHMAHKFHYLEHFLKWVFRELKHCIACPKELKNFFPLLFTVPTTISMVSI